MEGLKAKTTSMYDGEAREIAHVKNVSDLVSKVGTSNIAHRNIVSLTNGSSVRCASFFFYVASQVLYRQKWDETKDRYLLPPDAPELVLAVKNAANLSKVGIWPS